VAVVKDKKDVSVLIETHLPEFVTEKHPKFKKFVEKYYEFMESHQLYFGKSLSFNEYKLQPEDAVGEEYFLREDGRPDESDGGNPGYPNVSTEGRLQLESDRDIENDANVQFSIGETLTGNTSQATAIVTGTKGNTIAFIKTTNDASFKYGEKVTGDATRVYATLANGVIDGTFPKGSIESFRSRGAGAAVRDLKKSQDIDLANEGVIDVSWKKEFYVNIPKTAKTDRRLLLKQMKEVYRSKGNEASFSWLFRTLFAKDDIEFYYPKKDLLRLSDGKWVLDKTIKFSTSTGTNISLFTGRKITGASSGCTALVERQVTYFAGSLEITELTLSSIVESTSGFFIVDEKITSETDANGKYATAITAGIIQTVTVNAGGTNYIAGDEIHVTAGGGQGARARVTSVSDGVLEGINVVDSGDGYSIGDPINFNNEETGGSSATGSVKTIIKTGEVLKNTDLMDPEGAGSFVSTTINSADYENSFSGHNANTHLFGNSSLIFSADIKTLSAAAISANGFTSAASAYDASKHILDGDRIAKKISIDTDGLTVNQSSQTLIISTALSDTERRSVVGGIVTYANGNTNIITGFGSNNSILKVRDEHVFTTGEAFSIDYASNTYWGTIISANTTKFLYSIGSYYRDSDVDALTVQNFVADDNIIVYDSKSTKLGAPAAASGIDAHNMHNGITFQVNNAPTAVTTNTFDMINAHGGANANGIVVLGAFNMTTVNVGAIDTFTLIGGVGYKSLPPISVANGYIPSLGNALDVAGANNALLNLNLHSYSTGTIAQSGTTVSLDTDGSFPDANSGVLTLTYANGATDQVISVTNSSTLSVSTEKIFGLGLTNSPDRQTYSLSYMARANNITRNTLLYNDDYSARGRVLDFIDKSSDNLKLSRIGNPVIASGNTTLRVDMTTVKDFGTALKYYITIDNTGPGTLSCVKNSTTIVTTADTSKLVAGMTVTGTGIPGGATIASIVNSTSFALSAAATDSLTSTLTFTSVDVGDEFLLEDGSKIYTEATTGERVTAHSNSVSTYSSEYVDGAWTEGSITQSGTTVTGVDTVFPNDFVRGTITYADNATSTITGHTNATSFTVADSKTIGSAQGYSIGYNPGLTWGTARNVSVSAAGIGNREVTVSETGHYLRTGDKVKISGSETPIFNGIFPVTVKNINEKVYVISEAGDYIQLEDESAGILTDDYDISPTYVKNTTYTYTLPADTTVISPSGNHKVISVASAWLATSNAAITDTSIKGKNAVIEASAVTIGAIKTATIYDFGAGYISTPTLSTTSGDQNAVLTAGFGSVATYDGYNSGTTGTLSGVPKLQDNKYYQAFSYVLKTDFDVNEYRDSVKRLTHPSGLIMFGEVAIRNKISAALFNAANNNVDDLVAGRKYHNITLFQNAATTNVQFQTFGSNNELEIYTADHPWQAMDARLEIDDEVNLQLELYTEIDSIARVNSTMHTVTHTLHGLETGDVIAISGDLTEPQQWQGPHTITGVPTTNTYTITPTFDVYDIEYPAAELYDGTLQIQLENEILGNNVIQEDGVPAYSTSAHKKFTISHTFGSIDPLNDLLMENGDYIVQEDGVSRIIEDWFLRLAKNGYYFPVAIANSSYTGDVVTNHATFGSATKKFTITGYNSETNETWAPGSALIVGTETLGTFVNTDTVYLHSSAGSNIDDAVGRTISSDLTSVGVYSANTSAEGNFSLVDGINPSHYLKARTSSYANTFRASATNWDDPFSGKFLVEETESFILMLMEDGDYLITEDGFRIARDETVRNVFDLKLEQGGAYLYPKLQFPEEESGTVSIDMSFNSDILLEDDNGAYGWGYLLDEASGSMGSGPQRYISLEEDTEGIKEGHITQSIPYMETQATIELIDSMRYHLITEDGDKISSEENLRTYWTVVLEGDNEDNLIMETGDFIEYELNSSIFWADPHEIYSHITTPENLLLEHNTWTIIHSAPVYQYIDYLTTLGKLTMEDGFLLVNETSDREYDESYFYLEKKDYFLDKSTDREYEFILEDSMGYHLITEDYDHFIEEGDENTWRHSRFVTGESHVKTSTREIEFTNLYGPQRWSSVEGSENFLYESINDWKDTNIATVSYGMQAFRPHYYSQWASIGLGFVDGNFQMEDNTGIILLEHPVTNQDALEQEDFPGVLQDIMNTDKDRLDLILLENQTNWETDGKHFDYILAEEVHEEKYISLETSRVSGEGPENQAWVVLPAYQYTRVPTRLAGLITIADEGTAVTGTEYSKFTTQLQVGEEFQTEDVTIIAEDSGGDVVLETNERLLHEDITLADVEVFVLDTARDVELRDFRWLMSQEDSTIAAHSSHTNVIGIYLERSYPGGNETTAWNTNDESFWIPTHETNDRIGITKVVSGSDDGKVRIESAEWENINMLWEDMSKQLIIEPQAFIVGSITNDTSMSVTRKHLGGVTEAEYRL